MRRAGSRLPIAWALVLLTLVAGVGGVTARGVHGLPPSPTSVPLVRPAATRETAPTAAPNPLVQSTVSYNSSVDSFPLSYTEVLPTGYSSSVRYPLLVELHGISVSETTPMRGGYPTAVDTRTAQASASAGFLLVIPNTRTGTGFYVDSPYTGPQAQDIQDAIASEEARRLVGPLYLYGFSMGAMGSISIGLQHPTEFVGLGAVATFSDIYELYDYQEAHNVSGLNGALLAIAGGVLPNASTFSHQIFDELSMLRAHSGLTKGIRMYFANGANDLIDPNNPNLWPYLEGNSSLLQTSCLIDVEIAEAANCTVPVASLHGADPLNYTYRYVYEANGVHDYGLLNPSDMLAYFQGQVPSGTYDGTYPIPAPTPPAVPLVTLTTQPFGCGTISWAGTPYPSGNTLSAGPGGYLVLASPCPGYTLSALVARDGVTYDPLTGYATVTASGALVAEFTTNVAVTKFTIIVATTSGCPTVSVNGTVVASGSGVTLAAGSYVAEATPCTGYSFLGWSSSGGVRVWNPSQGMTGFGLTGTGGIVAAYVPLSGTVTVGVLEVPPSCGPVLLNGASMGNGTAVALLPGTYPIAAPACTGYSFVGWGVRDGLVVSGASAVATLNVSGTGVLTAQYARLGAGDGEFRIAFLVAPAACGAAIGVDGALYANGTAALLVPGSHNLSVARCAGYAFDSWTGAGGVAPNGASLAVSGNGTLLASFVVEGPGPSGATNTSSFLPAWLAPYGWVAGGLLIGLLVGVGAAISVGRRNRAAPSAPSDES